MTATQAGAPPGSLPDASRAQRRRQAKDLGAVLLVWLLFFAAWEGGARYLGAVMLPGPITVAAQMVDIIISGNFIEHFQWSLLKTILGYLLAGALGIPIGYLMGRYDYWKSFFQDGMTIAGTIPALTYAVFALVIFGISMQGPVVAVGLICTPFVAINVAEGVRSVDRDLLAMSTAYGKSGREIQRHIVIPTVAPYAFAAVRMTFAVAWKVEALTEVFGGSNGIGYEIRRAYIGYSMEGVLAWMFLFITFMLLVERFVLVRLEKWVFKWRPSERT